MIAGLNYINKVSCECKCEFDGKINGRITINVYVSVENVMYV